MPLPSFGENFPVGLGSILETLLVVCLLQVTVLTGGLQGEGVRATL